MPNRSPPEPPRRQWWRCSSRESLGLPYDSSGIRYEFDPAGGRPIDGRLGRNRDWTRQPRKRCSANFAPGFDEGREEGPEKGGEEADLFSVFVELAGLRNEVRTESRLVKDAQFRGVFDTLQASHAAMEADLSRARADTREHGRGPAAAATGYPRPAGPAGRWTEIRWRGGASAAVVRKLPSKGQGRSGALARGADHDLAPPRPASGRPA